MLGVLQRPSALALEHRQSMARGSDGSGRPVSTGGCPRARLSWLRNEKGAVALGTRHAAPSVWAWRGSIAHTRRKNFIEIRKFRRVEYDFNFRSTYAVATLFMDRLSAAEVSIRGIVA